MRSQPLLVVRFALFTRFQPRGASESTLVTRTLLERVLGVMGSTSHSMTCPLTSRRECAFKVPSVCREWRYHSPCYALLILILLESFTQRSRHCFIQDIYGLLIKDSTDIMLKGEIGYDYSWSYMGPPMGGTQWASVVITGESSGVEFKDLEGIEAGPGG